MKQLQDFHHYKGDTLTRYEKVERKVIEIILSIKDDNAREDSKVFEFMHACGSIQIARILAQKRKLNIDIAATATILHDIQTIISGKHKDHARLGTPIAEKILKEVGGFSKKEIETITNAILHHSEKEIYSKDPYTELVKDADVFECSLYKNAGGWYRMYKPQRIYKEYVKRIKKVRKELGLPIKTIFR